MKESCELCKSQARIYCDSDKARLCWSCDAKVHSANFLVARHSRCLLCHVCQSQTAWNAAGEKLGRTVSVCERCVDGCHRVKDERCNDYEIESERDYDGDDNDDEDETDGDDDDEDDDDIDLDEEDEDEDNQVVPWSSISPPPSPSSCSSRDCRSRFCTSDSLSSKRMPDNFPDLCSDDDFECLSSQPPGHQSSPLDPFPYRSTGGDVDSSSMRPSKVRKIEANRLFNVQHNPAGLRSLALVESLKRLHQEDINSG